MLTSLDCSFSQIINSNYFPTDNKIDKSYNFDIKKWNTNSEWIIIIEKYSCLWKNQMVLEMDRLKRVLPDQIELIKSNQNIWEQSLNESISLVNNNVDFNKVGKEPGITYFADEMEQYKKRAKYYFCLYYTVLEMSENYNIKQEMILAE